jgi:uncharacterized protein YbgA (DUF1722 family)/uncharacterized protein YbbK (DUF523 family)
LNEKIKLGVSACLLGKKVRYDGGHKRDRFLTDTLSRYVEYVPVCPEVEYGLGIPRESLRLVGDPDAPRLITSRTQHDHTEGMLRFARKRVAALAMENLCGFIFKSDSPTSGMERVRVYNDKGMPVRKGAGIFARVFMECFPLIPVEEEGRLHDAKLRENFIESIFTLKRWREILEKKKSVGELVDFHSRNKLLLLSHSTKHYRMMGSLVAEGKAHGLQELYSKYETLLLEALKLKATVNKHFNVLQHMMGYFKKQLAREEKQELLSIFQDYKEGHIPLIVPITLVNHYVRKYKEPYLSRQDYLQPHPVELQLRNHV